jgi:hypothetical protein
VAIVTVEDLDPLATYDPELASAAGRCNLYFHDHGFPVALDLPTRRILLNVSGLVGAVTVPATTAAKVLKRLDMAMSSGPVVDSGNKGWIFLTSSPRSLNDDTVVDLLRLSVTVHNVGERLTLPSPEEERLGLREWHRKPVVDRDLPPQSLVVAMTRLAGAEAR